MLQVIQKEGQIDVTLNEISTFKLTQIKENAGKAYEGILNGSIDINDTKRDKKRGGSQGVYDH